ncbi:MAG TPA: hypothetical protein VMC43_03270 [Candidatus Paceibacterota bacterium]|nr:hypothetical protein [Candidatus Paceibacterota bacterium]
MVHISWEAPEFDYHEKSMRWLWVSMLGALIILGFAVWQKDFLFGFFIVVAEVLVLSWSIQSPRRVTFTLDEHGLSIGEHGFYALNDLESFSVDSISVNGLRTFAIHTHRRFRLPIHVKVPDVHTDEIRAAFNTLLPENPWEETFIDSLERFFHF